MRKEAVCFEGHRLAAVLLGTFECFLGLIIDHGNVAAFTFPAGVECSMMK